MFDDIYCSKFVNGSYGEPENLGGSINSKGYESYPFIAPDESYLIFSGAKRADSFGDGDLFISYRDNHGSWTKAVNLGKTVNDEHDNRFPMIGRDGKFLFFVSDESQNGLGEVYWVGVEGIIK